MKPLGAQWSMELHAYMLAKPEVIQNGFRAAVITNVHATCVLCSYYYYTINRERIC